MTPADKAEVERRAQEAGVNVQDYVWSQVLHRPFPEPRKAGVPSSAGEELPLSR